MKKRLLILVIVVVGAGFVLASCSRAESPREFADKFIAAEDKAWITGNVDDLRSLEDADIIYHLPGLELKGWKAHEDYIVNGRPTVSDLKQDWKYVSGEGNHLILTYDSSAVLKGNDNSPSQAISNNYLFVLRLKDQKVVEVWANGSSTNKPVEAKK